MTVIAFPPRFASDYFGGCRACGKNDGFLNVGRDHWFVCHEHKQTWCVGSNLFSGWRDQTEADWARNRETLKSYSVVEPLPWEGAAPW